MKKRYEITYDWNQTVTVEVDHDVMTDAKLHEINRFWSGADERIQDYEGSVLWAVLVMLAQRCLRLSITELGSVKDCFNWKTGHGVEGWPTMDGSDGITLISVDDFEFDEDEFVVKEVPL